MRVLVIENYPGTPLGQVERALDEAGAERVHARAFEGDAVPSSPDGFDALVLLGGGQNALDDENHSWFPTTLDLIRAFTSAEKSVLGICLGAQLVARAHGGQNHVGGHHEFGWHPVEVTQAAAKDAVFAGLPEQFPIFQWHDDHFSLPPGAVRLATSPVAGSQAFRIGRATYATQFHFEADRRQVDVWSTSAAATIAKSEPDWPQRHGKDAALYGETADATGLSIARAWVATI
jgi:GMP synthase-like glutamine amidotransferase